jgi:hypothetical protein
MVEFVPPSSSGVGLVHIGVPFLRSGTRDLLLRAREENSFAPYRQLSVPFKPSAYQTRLSRSTPAATAVGLQICPSTWFGSCRQRS